MKKLTCLLLCAFFMCNLFASNDLIVNTSNRESISLDGKWHIIVDPYLNGYFDYRLKPSAWGYFLNAKPASKTDLVEYDFDKSPVINVPGDWNTQLKELYYYEGTVWYKKSFSYTKSDKRAFIYFGAVNYHAIVYLNGKKMGEHTGGFTPFNFEVTDALVDGENTVVVKIDNTRQRDGVPTVNTDWWNYGGITRSVKIIETPGTFIRDYFIQLEKDKNNVITGFIELSGDLTNQKMGIKIPGLNMDEQVKPDNGRAVFSIKANPELWSTENPKTYQVEIYCETDKVVDQVGFRNISVDGDRILLNNKPVFLKGISIHEEAPYRTGRAHTPQDAATLLGWAKEMGCNFVRLAHYPHNEQMIKTAEELGLLVWSEIPVYWTINWENAETYQNAENQLAEMINRDKNRAAVIIWSMANETPLSEARNTFLKKLVDKARSLDNTRLISAALEKEYPEDSFHPVVNDPFGEYLDVLSFNEYVGWYDGLHDKCKKVIWEIKYNKPVIVSEFGAGALQGYYADDLTRWTEDYQETLYHETTNMLETIPHFRGTTPWILMDFRSPRRVLPGIQDDFNRKGLISEQGIKKKAFYVMQQWYNSDFFKDTK